MALSDRQLLDALSQAPFIDAAEMVGVFGEPHATVHRALTGLLADRIVGRVSLGTAHPPSSQRYYLTANGIGEAAGTLGFATPSDFVRAYPVSREWLALLIRRMDAVAAVYRLAASLSPSIDSLRSHVEFHRRGRFDSTITWLQLENGIMVHLIETPDAPASPHNIHHAFEVEDLEGTKKILEENGFKVEREGVRYDGQAFLFIDDPDGNNVEFCTASGYAPAPPRP